MYQLPYVLVAEDDLDDRELIKEAFVSFATQYKLMFYGDGEELLNGVLDKKEVEFPKLILLDLNMPRKGGLETLKELKQIPDLSEVPIVIFSTSQSKEDKKNCLNSGANDFVTKPITYVGLVDAVKYIMNTWG